MIDKIEVKIVGDPSEVQAAMRRAAQSVSEASTTMKTRLADVQASSRASFSTMSREARQATDDVDRSALRIGDSVHRMKGAFSDAGSTFRREFDQSSRLARLESDMRRSTTSITSQIRSMAGAFAGYLTGRELAALSDSFTRLQNNLRIAGVEGEHMKAVQDRLFKSAQQYGVEVEGLSKLFSTMTQVSKELGASEQDVFKLTDAVSASLKVAGISSQEASGALLQLGQALRGGKVQAEEYNSLIDGLYPLLEAAANGSDRWKGSVAKLTADVKASKVSSQEFFRAILEGSDVLDQKAAKATLTLSAGFTILTNAITVYFGEADKAKGISAAIGETMGMIADNLDVLIPSIALVATYIGVNYVTSAVTATAATGALSAAMFALQARMAGAATTAEALGFAMGALGLNPVVLAITALGGAFYYLATREQTAADAALRYREAINAASAKKTEAIDLAHKLASATGDERKEVELAIGAALKKAQADQIAAAAAVKRAAAELALAQATANRLNEDAKKTPGRGSAEIGFVQGEANRNVRIKQGELEAQQEALKTLTDTIEILKHPLEVPPLPKLQAVGGGTEKGKGKGGAGSSAPSRLEQWRSELDDGLLLEEKAGRDTLAFTEKFWSERLKLTTKGSKDELQVTRELVRVQIQLQRQQTSEELSSIRQAETLKSRDVQTEVALKRIALDEKLSMIEAERDEGRISAMEAVRLKAEANREIYRLDLDLEQREFEIRRDSLRSQAQNYADGTRERADYNRQIELLEAQHQQRMALLQRKYSADERLREREGMNERRRNITQLTSAWSQSISRMVTLQQSFAATVRSIWQSAADLVAGALEKVIQKWLEKQLAALILGRATQAATGVAQVTSNAAIAASAAFASTAAIPIVGPALAPAAAASALGAVMAFAPMAAAKQGWDVPAFSGPGIDGKGGQMAVIHPREMVLPEDLADVVRGGGSGGSAPPIYISALDARSVKRLFEDHGSDLARALRKHVRNGGR